MTNHQLLSHLDTICYIILKIAKADPEFTALCVRQITDLHVNSPINKSLSTHQAYYHWSWLYLQPVQADQLAVGVAGCNGLQTVPPIVSWLSGYLTDLLHLQVNWTLTNCSTCSRLTISQNIRLIVLQK